MGAEVLQVLLSLICSVGSHRSLGRTHPPGLCACLASSMSFKVIRKIFQIQNALVSHVPVDTVIPECSRMPGLPGVLQ